MRGMDTDFSHKKGMMPTITIFIFLFIATISTTEAQSRLIGIVNVNGTLYCSPNGGAISGSIGNATPVFPNATMQVACTSGVMAAPPYNVTTNANGAYLISSIPSPNATISSIVSECRVFVLTPLSSCNRGLPAVGLVSGLQFVRTVPTMFWYISYMVASGFAPQG